MAVYKNSKSILLKFFEGTYEKNFKTDDHLKSLDNMINYMAPYICAQNGWYISKMRKDVVEERTYKLTSNFNAFAHIQIGQPNKLYNSILSTCLHKSLRIEVAAHQVVNWGRSDWLIVSNGTAWAIINSKKLYNDCKFDGDNDYNKLTKVLPKSWVNPRFPNFCIMLDDLMDNGYIVSYGKIYDEDHYIDNRGIHKLSYKDDFGKVRNTKKLPRNFTKYRVHSANNTPKYMICRLEMSDSDTYREYTTFSNLKSIYSEFNKMIPDIGTYRAFLKCCTNSTEKAKNSKIGQRPKVYKIKDGCHFIVLENIDQELAFDYVRKVKSKYG